MKSIVYFLFVYVCKESGIRRLKLNAKYLVLETIKNETKKIAIFSQFLMQWSSVSAQASFSISVFSLLFSIVSRSLLVCN